MSGDENRIETAAVAQMVEQYVDDQISRAAKYDNVSLLDEGSVYDLHTLAAQIYAEGYQAGASVEAERIRRERYRQRDTNAGEGQS